LCRPRRKPRCPIPRHDYSCSQCGETVEVYRPVSERATDRPPLHCDVPMLWIPAVGAMDAREPFQTFPIQVKQPNGTYKEVTIDSLAKLRKVERDSEVAARNGEGEAIRARMWSHDRSNGDVNAFGPDPSVAPTSEAKARFGLRGGTKPIDAPESVTLGPGVTEANVSALK